MAVQEMVYEMLYGEWDWETSPVPGMEFVQSLFDPGSPCTLAYEEMLAAYSRLCRRLSSAEWEDPDVEIVINQLCFIGKMVGMKMYEYGVCSVFSPALPPCQRGNGSSKTVTI